MRKNKEEREKSHIRINNIIALFTVAVLCFISIGFALYNQVINLNGNVSVNSQGDFYISGVRLISSTNVNTSNVPTHTDDTVSFNLVFTDLGEDTYTAVYEIDITNDTFYDRTFNGLYYEPVVKDGEGNIIDDQYFSYTISGIDEYVFPRLSTTTLTISIVFDHPVDGEYIVEGDLGIDAVEKPEGNLRGTITSSIGDLTGNNDIVPFTINVINTYTTNREFRLRLSNSNFVVCDQNGNDISFNINANTEQEFTFYVKKKEGAIFNNNSYDVNVSLISTNLPTTSSGTITLLVDESSGYTDEDPPVISNLSASILDTNGSVEVSFIGSDENNISEYHVLAYRNNNLVSNVTVNNTSYTFTSLEEGTYYFVVYGIDSEGNSGESYMSNATTDEGFAVRTLDMNCKWVFSVTYNLTNLNGTNGTVNRGQTYTGTITSTRFGLTTYNVPNNLDSVTMGGTALTRSEYSYTRNNNERGIITIPNVTGDIVIRATGVSSGGGCLVEGTKILLANGKYKNIEDIDYNDLLTVFNHVTGKITYVYPIWLENKQVSDNYIKVLLEDDTSINFVKDHSIYNADTNMYASILDSNQIDIGSSVYKLKNKELVKVKIKKIETINKRVNYYNIVSTIHYNVFSNDILTSDSTAAISNVYGFNENMTYSDNYNVISNGEKLSYDKVSFIPKHLYYGLNLSNASFIDDYDINIYDLLNTYTNDDIMKSINNNYIVNIDNIVKRVNEGTKYKLPNDKSIKYYIETSTNKKYKPGSYIKVNYSIYLKSVKK